ncbi:MAG: hypothetical protein Q6K18_07100 [Gloeomargarita sp. DG_1_5_bins_55]
MGLTAITAINKGAHLVWLSQSSELLRIGHRRFLPYYDGIIGLMSGFFSVFAELIEWDKECEKISFFYYA